MKTESPKQYTVYALVNKRTRHIRYIGQTTNRKQREYQHRQKYPTLKMYTLVECDSEFEMNFWEWFLIECWEPPLNQVAGGGANPMSDPKLRAKAAAGIRKYYANPKNRKAVSERQKKYYAENPDKHPSKRPEVVEKASAAKSKPVICLTTGEWYPSAKEVEMITKISNGHISECMQGKRKSAGKTPDGRKRVWAYV